MRLVALNASVYQCQGPLPDCCPVPCTQVVAVHPQPSVPGQSAADLAESSSGSHLHQFCDKEQAARIQASAVELHNVAVVEASARVCTSLRNSSELLAAVGRRAGGSASSITQILRWGLLQSEHGFTNKR